MAYQDKTPPYIKLDERNHVERPLLDQLAGLGWEVIDLDSSQTPAQSLRELIRGGGAGTGAARATGPDQSLAGAGPGGRSAEAADRLLRKGPPGEQPPRP